MIEGKGLIIIGAGADKVELVTNAGYGVLFLNSRGSSISGVTITGGKRDVDGAATDAAIVVKFSSVTVKNCLISGNTDFIDSVIVGIAGIVGREGSNLIITHNRIINNSWDGIALYRGAEAYISDNIIRQGRGSFGDSQALVKNNIVRDCLGWGIIVSGSSYMDAANNVVYHNGNCGMAVWSEEAQGRFTNNIVARNGWKEQWVAPGVGIQNYGGYKNFDISYNDVWDNQAGEYGDMPDLTGKKGNISLNPNFVAPDSGDFGLNLNSSCIDRGNPLISDPDGSFSDMGVYPGLRVWKK